MYELHRAVGAVLRSIEYPNIEVLLDSACGGEGKRLRLYGGSGGETPGGDSLLASVNAALIVNGEIGVVIGIELSDVRPIYLCAKVFATALSNYHSHHSREPRIPLAERMMFIQVIQYPDGEPQIWFETAARRKARGTYRPPGYVHLEREISRLLRDTKSRVWRYVFHYGFSKSFDLKGSDAKAFKKEILDFLPLVPNGQPLSTRPVKPIC
jgi:hypothetical protein